MRVDQTKMTPKEAAKLIGMSQSWLCRKRKIIGGGPDFFNFDGRYFYYKEDIERWRESKRNAGQVRQ